MEVGEIRQSELLYSSWQGLLGNLPEQAILPFRRRRERRRRKTGTHFLEICFYFPRGPSLQRGAFVFFLPYVAKISGDFRVSPLLCFCLEKNEA